MAGVIVLVAVAGMFIDRRVVAQARDSALQTRRSEQRLQQQTLRLSETDAVATLHALQESLDALTLRLMETLDAAGDTTGIGRMQYQLIPVAADDVTTMTAAMPKAFVARRLAISAEFAHAAVLIRLLDQIREQARKWPLELQGCVIERPVSETDHQPARLDASCEFVLWHRQSASLL